MTDRRDRSCVKRHLIRVAVERQVAGVEVVKALVLAAPNSDRLVLTSRVHLPLLEDRAERRMSAGHRTRHGSCCCSSTAASKRNRDRLYVSRASVQYLNIND